MVRIISVEREYGCGAPNIAQSIADRLGWKLWDQQITEEIARRLKCKAEQVEAREERCDSMFYRLIKTFMGGRFEPRVDTANMELLDAEHLALLFRKSGFRDCGPRQCGDRGAGRGVVPARPRRCVPCLSLCAVSREDAEAAAGRRTRAKAKRNRCWNRWIVSARLSCASITEKW